MSTLKSDTVKVKLSEIRECCIDLMEQPETPIELQLEDTDEPAKGSDPCNRTL